jgi:hypothetical protein
MARSAGQAFHEGGDNATCAFSRCGEFFPAASAMKNKATGQRYRPIARRQYHFDILPF